MIFYICDGKDPNCKRTNCYLNGNGECKHTRNIRHARNFNKNFRNDMVESDLLDGENIEKLTEAVKTLVEHIKETDGGDKCEEQQNS